MARRRVAMIAVMAALVGLLALPDRHEVEAAPTTDLLVGDSVMAGMSSASRSVLGNHVFDARVCRRLVATSCTYNGSRPANALSVVRANAGRVNRAIVVAVGYNDGSIGSAVDAIVAEARRQGVRHVVWLTYRIAGSYAGTYRSHNATLWAKAAQHPELRIVDWASASAGRGDWVAGDGLHLTSRGASAMAGLIASALASLAPPPPTRCDLAAGGVRGQPQTSATTTGPATGIVMHASPQRLIDTRATRTGAVRAGHYLRVPVPANVAGQASAVVATITAVDPCRAGYVTAYECGASMPRTSTLNPNRGGATASMTIVPLSSAGAICIYTSLTVDLVVDLVGHLAPSGQRLRTIAPVRLVDTRPGFADQLAVPDGKRAAGSVIAVPIRSAPAVGAGDSAVSLNLTVTQPDGRGYVSVYPGPCSSRPNTSNLNHVASETIAVAAIARIGSDGTVCVYNRTRSHVVVDLTGVIGGTGSRLRTTQNVRLVDTRTGAGASTGDLRVPTSGAPAGHAGAVVNTVALGLQRGYVTVRPCGASGAPATSTVNHQRRPIANMAVVDTSGSAFCVYRRSPAHLVVDALAWLVP